MKLRNLTFAAIGIFATLPAHGQTFHGYTCTEDCSGHEAGYEWAERKGMTSADDCGGRSNSFIEGCKAYAEQFEGSEEAVSYWGVEEQGEDESGYGYGYEEDEELEDEEADEEGYWEDSDDGDWR